MLLSLPYLAQNNGSPLGGLIFFIPLILIFYLLLIRPQQRRARQQRELLASLSVGDEVVTVGGMFGVVHALDDDEVTIEISDGILVRFRRSAIAGRLSYEEEEPEEEPGGREEEEEAGEQS